VSRALLRLANTLLKDKESARDNHVLAKYSSILKILSLKDSFLQLNGHQKFHRTLHMLLHYFETVMPAKQAKYSYDTIRYAILTCARKPT